MQHSNKHVSLTALLPWLPVLVMLPAIAALGQTQPSGGPQATTRNQPAFPIGLYSVPATERDFTFVKQMGVNYVHTYGIGGSDTPQAIAKARHYLDFAQAHGLKVMVNLRGKSWVGKPDGLAHFKSFVNAVKDHPAVGMWYLYDEPDGKVTPRQLEPYYKCLKKTTPGIPVSLALNWTAHWTRYNQVCDVIQNDIYPVAGEEFPRASIQHVTTFTGHALKLGPVVMPVLQCFNWADIAPKGAKTYRNSPVDKLRYPDIAELRYMIYATMAQGAGGEFFWSYYRGDRYDHGRWMKSVFAPVIRNLRSFTDQVGANTRPTRLRRAEDNNVFLSLWTRGGEHWLVMVNAWPQERDLNAWTEGNMETAKLEPLEGTRDVRTAVSHQHIKVHARPWETFVWKVIPSAEASR